MKSKNSKYPEYKHDAAQYGAACLWLFGNARLPKPPLPEIIYQLIASDMINIDGRWEFNNRQAAESTEHAAKLRGIEIGYLAPRAFGIVLKSLYIGMYRGYAQGVTDGPCNLGIRQNPESGDFAIGRDEFGTASFYFTNFPSLSERLLTIEMLIDKDDQASQVSITEMGANVAMWGFLAQCQAHFLNKHIELSRTNPEVYEQRQDAYVERQVEVLKENSISHN